MIKQQRGLTAISWMIIIALVAIQGVMAIRIIPVYLTFSSVKSIMNEIETDPDMRGQTPKYIRSAIEQRLQINSIYDVQKQPGAFGYRQLSDGIEVTVNYESRGPIYGNLDFIATFSHAVVVPKN